MHSKESGHTLDAEGKSKIRTYGTFGGHLSYITAYGVVCGYGGGAKAWRKSQDLCGPDSFE